MKVRLNWLLLAAVSLWSGAAAAATEIVVWHAYRAEEKAAFEKVVKAYNDANADKGIQIKTLAVPYDAMADKISAAVPRGKGPDLFIYAQDRLGGWIETGGTVEPLDFMVDKPTRERFLPTTLEAMTYRKRLFGLPLNFKVITMIYNRKLLPTPPKTSKELAAVAKKLTDAKAGRFGLAYSYSDFYYHAALMNAFGGHVFEPGTSKPTMSAPANVKALEYLQGWMKQGILPAEPSTALITSLFNEGKAAMVFSGPWFLGEVAKGIDYGLAPLPKLDEAGGKPMAPWMTVEGVYVAAPSKNKKEAFAFAKYLTSVDAAKVLALEGRQSPAVKAVYDDAQVGADPVLKAFRQQVEVAVPMPNLPEMTMVWSPATTAMNTIVKGTAQPKAALEIAQTQVQKDVSALRKKQ
ncbi:MAG TPA: extracellular solute-binding protein [Myxococcaceae bacterium]|nr:extracellular solute-binding protein [Myxococcaceae bacterium]